MIVALLALFLQVVSSRAEVQVGQAFTVTVTAFDAGVVQMQLPPGVELIETNATVNGTTLTSRSSFGLTVRATQAGDLRFVAQSGGVRAVGVVRVCCRVAERPKTVVYLAVVRK